MPRLRTLLLALLLPAALPAQAPVTFGVGVSLQSPTGQLGRDYRTGYGVALTGDLLLDPRWSLAAAVQQIRFGGTSDNTPGPTGARADLDITGLTAGVRSFVSGGSAQFGGLYLATDLGWFRMRTRDPITRERDEETEIGLLPTLGYRTRLFDTSAQLKLGGRYQWVQLRGALTLVRW
jgi:hypothetical protein